MSEASAKPAPEQEFLPAKVKHPKGKVQRRLGDRASRTSWNKLATMQNRQMFYMRLLRHMENDQYQALTVGFNKLFTRVKECDPWAMEFVRDTLDGKPGNRIMMNPEAPGKQITITINADDSAVL